MGKGIKCEGCGYGPMPSDEDEDVIEREAAQTMRRQKRRKGRSR